MKHIKPPKWPEKLLSKFLNEHLLNAVFGDLEQQFEEDLKSNSPGRARLYYILNALGFFRYFHLRKKRNYPSHRLNPIDMFFNYFKTSLRSFSRRIAYFLLNMLGLSIGIASFLAIQKYVEFEKSFDKFHHKAHEIKRILRYNSNDNSYLSSMDPDVAVRLKDEMPGFSAVTRFYLRNNGAFEVTLGGEVDRYEDFDLLYADADFFSVFSFEFLFGNSSTPLDRPNSIILSEGQALRLFGTRDAVGKLLSFKDPNFPLIQAEVVAVIRDVPKNSHFSFDAMLSLNTPVRDGQSLDKLGWNAYQTYVRTNASFDASTAEAQLESVARSHFAQNENLGLTYQPLTDIHLNSKATFGLEQGKDKRLVNYLSLTSLFILLMAYFNYINFSTAKSLERAKEVGVRKVLGSRRSHLVVQFLTETVLINLFSLVAALCLLVLMAPLIPIEGIDFRFPGLFDFYGNEIGLLIGALVIGTGISGFYPALLMSGWKPTVVLRGKLSGSLKGRTTRSVLTTLQSVVSLTLIVITTVIYSQVKYMIDQDKGINIEQVLIIETPRLTGGNERSRLRTYKTQLMTLPFVKSVSTSSTLPGSSLNYATPVRRPDQPVRDAVRIYTDGIDEQFLEHYEIDLLAGRVFNPSFGSEWTNTVLNRTATRMLGFDSPEEALQQQVIMENDTIRVIGVIEDYNHFSLKQAYAPQILRYYGSWVPQYSVKVQQGNGLNWAGILRELEDSYREAFDNSPFEYRFLDQAFNLQYEEDLRFGSISGFFSGIAIIIAILGLLGFVAFTISVKSKEIAIRKVLGASKGSIIMNLSRSTLLLNLLAGTIAAGMAYFYLNQWLGQYAYQLQLSALHFLVPLAGMLAIVLFIIVVQSMSLLSKNPVTDINNER